MMTMCGNHDNMIFFYIYVDLNIMKEQFKLTELFVFASSLQSIES